MKFVEGTYLYMSRITIVLYLLIIFGLRNRAPHYLENLFFFINVFIGLVFVIYFNPLSKTKFKKYHKTMIFWAGVALITNLSLDNVWERSKELKKDIEDDGKEITRKTKKEVSSHIEFLSNTVKKFYTNTKGSLKTLKEKSKEKSKQMFSKLYENIFGEPKAKENVVKLVRKS